MDRLILAIMLGALVCAVIARCDGVRRDDGRVRLDIGGERFSLEVAADDAARAQGLQGRSEIASDGGMLFVFPSAQVQSFWMVDCLVDIDIIFLDGQGRVTALHRMKAEPPQRAGEPREAYERRLRRYSSVYPAQFAVELRAGTLDRLGLKVDSKVPLDTTALKARAH